MLFRSQPKAQPKEVLDPKPIPPAKSSQAKVISSPNNALMNVQEDVKEVRSSQKISDIKKSDSNVEEHPGKKLGEINPSAIIEEVQEVDYSKVNKDQLNEINNLIKEFENAIKYVQEVGGSQNEGRLREKRVALGRFQKYILEGKAIDFFKMNIYLSPSDVTGMDEKERLKRFEEIISLLSNQVNLFKDRGKFLIEEAKKNVLLYSLKIL